MKKKIITLLIFCCILITCSVAFADEEDIPRVFRCAPINFEIINSEGK